MKEVKNSLSGVVLASLVAHNLFREAGHHHLPVGHTHEDVGEVTLLLPASVLRRWPFRLLDDLPVASLR